MYTQRKIEITHHFEAYLVGVTRYEFFLTRATQLLGQNTINVEHLIWRFGDEQLKPPIFLCMHNHVINNFVTMRLRSPSCEIVSSWLSEMALLKFMMKKN